MMMMIFVAYLYFLIKNVRKINNVTIIKKTLKEM